MKKTATSKTPSKVREALLPEYIFDYRKAKPNRFAGQKEDQVVVALDPDVAKVFQTPDSDRCGFKGESSSYRKEEFPNRKP
jgi:hypothetical protein